MKNSALVAMLIATLSTTVAAQETHAKDGFKPTRPRAGVTHGGAGGGGAATAMPVTTNLVGGSDSCATPDVLTGTGLFFFDNTTATTGSEGQGEASCLFYGSTAIINDVWFRWTSPFSGIARIDTCGTGSSIDTKIAVYPGAGCPASSAIGCDDDACPSFESTVDVNVVAGQTYTIQLGLYPLGGATPGSGQLSITQLLPPTEDDCSTPLPIAGTGTFAFDNTAATTGAQGQNEAACNFFTYTAIQSDVWYTWQSTFTGTARLDTCGLATGIDTKIAVYAGSGCPAGAAIACDDDSCPSLESTVVFPAVTGGLYTFQIGIYPGGTATPGSGTFSVQQYVGLPNDECSSPVALVGAGPHGYDTTNATTSANGQTNARCYIFNTSAISSDLWYSWTASSSGWVALNTCAGGSHDLKVAVYAGAGCPAAEPLSCDDDACGTIGASARAAFVATAGQQYLFQIGSYPGQAGASGFFTIDPFVPVAGDDCAAPVIVSGSGPFAWDTSNATTGFAGQSEALCSGEMITYDLWHRWTSTCTGQVTVSICNQSSSDTKLAVYSGSGCPAGSALVCADDTCGVGGGPSTVTFNAVAGLRYTIQVGHWPGDIPGVGAFTISTSCPSTAGTPYCFGDGSGTPCPCGNSGAAGNGCANSVVAAGGNLAATGNASITNDSIALQGSGMPNSSALYFQGTTQVSLLFGDGLRCAGGSVIRLGTKFNSGGASTYPTGADLPVAQRGLVTTPGTRTYQCWYRNAAAFCTPSTFNLTNGLEIAWSS